MKISNRLKTAIGEKAALESDYIFKKIISILEGDLKSNYNLMLREPKETLDWSTQQALLVGQVKQIKSLIALLTISGV